MPHSRPFATFEMDDFFLKMLKPNSRFGSWIWGMLIGMALLPACSEAPPATVPNPEEFTAAERHAQAWADSTLATLDLRQKAAQLIWVAAPTGLDSAGREVFASSLAANRFGGLVLDVGQRDSMRLLSGACLAHAVVPICVALDAGSAWSDAQGWPSLLSVGTVASDSLAHRWGYALGGECRYLGAQVCMISAGKVAEKGSWTADALSAAPAVVARLSDTLLTGIAEAGVQGCMRPLRDLADAPGLHAQGKRAPFAEDFVTLNAGAAMPLQRLLKKRTGLWLQATDATYLAVDALPIANSPRALGYFLRDKLDFKGLVLSPRGGMVSNLLAGTDVLVAPQDAAAAVAAIVGAVEAGSLQMPALDAAVRKQLLAKARLGLDRRVAQVPSRTDPYRSLLLLDRAIGKATMVVLRDTKGRLPLGANVIGKKIATVAFGNGQMTELQSAMGAYAAMDHFLLGARSDSLALAKQVEKYKKYDFVVLSLHEALVQDSASGRLSRDVVDFLHRLDRATQLVVLDMAGRNTLEDLHELSCLAFVSEDRTRNAKLAGQALMGAFPVTALLPDDVSPSFPAGTGKVLPHKLRFEYTEPEDLGIDPVAILRIDTLIDDAIKRHVFPGCQVFAAKDGKGFFAEILRLPRLRAVHAGAQRQLV